MRTRVQSLLGAAGSLLGGSQGENLPSKRTEVPTGRYITFPGNNAGIDWTIRFHAAWPAARWASAALCWDTEVAITGPVGGNWVKMTPETPLPGVSNSRSHASKVAR